MTQKSDPYTKVFSTLSEVILMCCIFSQLNNILYSSVIQPYFTKMTIYRYSSFTCYGHFMRSPTYWIWSKQSNPYIKTSSTSSGVRNMFFILTAVRYSLHKCSKRKLWLKRQFTVHISLVFCAMEFMEARKTCYRVVRTSIWSIPYSGELCNENCLVKTSETLIVWSAFSYTAGSDKSSQMQLKGCQTNC